MTIIVFTTDGKKRIFTHQPDELEDQLMDAVAANQGVSLTDIRKVRVNYGPGRISHAVFQRVVSRRADGVQK
ncbi:hypothetical protein PBI_SHIBA_77 [Arthrobacter phage Shiba]|nr:hypothetical protein PBI_SHIBA_77 [Arthrobacter phage Shiba]